MSFAIDPLRFAKTIAAGGMDRAQAEALPSALARGLKDGDVATKGNFSAASSELNAEIEAVRKDLKIEVTGLRTKIVPSRNQTMLAMSGISGLPLAVARFLP